MRNAFDDDQKPYLPKHILYRQKEEFSDGVGYSWIDGLKDHANKHVTDAMLMNASFVYPENTPTTKEAYYYLTIFEKFFPLQDPQFLEVPVWPAVLQKLSSGTQRGRRIPTLQAVQLWAFMQLQTLRLPLQVRAHPQSYKKFLWRRRLQLFD